MTTCETCEYWSKMFERCKRDHGKTHIDCCDKYFGCIHHEEKRDPVTVDVVVAWLRNWRKWSQAFSGRDTPTHEYAALAIKALEEMKAREELIPEVFVATNGDIFLYSADRKTARRCVKVEDKSINTTLPKPPTWPDRIAEVLQEHMEFLQKTGIPTSVFTAKMVCLMNKLKLLERTWKDVTAWEIVTELKRKGWDGDASDVKQTAEYLAEGGDAK